MNKTPLFFYYHNNLPWACIDTEECPTHIRQIILTTLDKAQEIMETPSLFVKERPGVAKAIKERQELYDLNK